MSCSLYTSRWQFITEESWGRNSSRIEACGQEVMQKPWRSATCWLSLHGLSTFCFVLVHPGWPARLSPLRVKQDLTLIISHKNRPQACPQVNRVGKCPQLRFPLSKWLCLCWGDRRLDRTLAYGLLAFNLCLKTVSMPSASCSSSPEYKCLSFTLQVGCWTHSSTWLLDRQPNWMRKPFQVDFWYCLFACLFGINPATSFVCNHTVPKSTPLLEGCDIKFFRTVEPNMPC